MLSISDEPSEADYEHKEVPMRKLIVLIALMGAAATPVLAQPSSTTSTLAITSATPVVASRGQMLIGSDHSRLGSVVSVEGDGSASIIFDGRMLTVPASTLKMAGGKLTTTLSKHELTAMQ